MIFYFTDTHFQDTWDRGQDRLVVVAAAGKLQQGFEVCDLRAQYPGISAVARS